jgi:DNA-binding CsgD family transcriptional regulator
MQRRLHRLRTRIGSTTKPIVWLRAGPGTGKTRLMTALRDRDGPVASNSWTLLDAPDAAGLRAKLNELALTGGHSQRRMLVASRPGDGADEVLLKPRIYGRIEILGDADLYLGREDCRAGVDTAMFAATAGWPMLADAWADGRGEEIRALLPEFLERDVLPGLPQALVAALFAASTTPLSAAAVAYLFRREPLSHPLLKSAGRSVTVSGTWVQEALIKLHRQSRALSPAVLEELTGFYTNVADPAEAIEAMLRIGQVAQAQEIFLRSGGAFFGYRHSYQALRRVLDAFGPDQEQRSEELFISHLWLLIKSGQTREALLRLEARHPGLPVDLRRLRLSHPPLAVLLRIDISLDIDETPPLEVIASWGRLQTLLPASDELARGLLFNTMAIGFLQADALLEAGQLAEEALAVYERAGSPYLAHFMQLHLCDVALRQGRLADAAGRLRRAAEALAESGLTFNSEPEIHDTFRSWIAYEEGRFADCPAETEPLLRALLQGDSWINLITSTAGHFVLTAYWRWGLRKALERLDHFALTLSRRHGWIRHQRLELVRIRLLQVARRHAEASMRLEEYDLEPGARRSAQLEVEEGLIRLRSLGTAERCGKEATQLAAALAGRPALEVRQKITLAILQSWLRHRSSEQAHARRHLRIALRDAEAHNLVGVLAEDGEFLERLLPLLIAEPGPGNTQLVAFAQRVLRLLHSLPAAPMHSKAVAGISRQEHRVLSYLADGYTNKQIARALSLSESTVKFHLRGLFRKMGVSSRSELAEVALQRGIMT